MNKNSVPMPVNVRLVDKDDNEYPVDMFYFGVDDNGYHEWHVVRYPLVKHVKVVYDDVPAMCCIMILEPPDEGE